MKESIKEIISEQFPGICMNTENNTVTLGGKKLPNAIYTKIGEIYQKKHGASVPKSVIKDAVEVYAYDHPYTPKKSEDTSTRKQLGDTKVVKKLLLTNKDGKTKQFDNVKDAIEYTGICQSSIYKSANGTYNGVKCSNQEAIDEMGERVFFSWVEVKETSPLSSPDDWMLKLAMKKTNGEIKPKSTVDNIEIVLENDPRMANKIGYNDFTGFVEFDGSPMTDFVESYIIKAVDDIIENIPDGRVYHAIRNVAKRNEYNEVQEYFKHLEWDGVSRVDDFFIKFLGAEDSELTRIVTRNWFYGTMTRIMDPGSILDFMIIVQDSKGGTGKSKLFERLGLNKYCVTISADEIGEKDLILKMSKAIICNFDELGGFSKKEMESIKRFITGRWDNCRMPYGRNDNEYKRHCSFCGSSNTNSFLRDYTDSYERRFMVLECHGDPTRNQQWWKDNLPDEYIDQVWAEIYWFREQNPNYNYSLDTDNITKMRNIQSKFKSINSDTKTKMQIIDTLNAVYQLNAGQFRSYADFNYKSDRVLRDNFQEGVDRINTIPTMYLTAKFTKSEGYIDTIILSKGWKKETRTYNGVEETCYVRENPITRDEDELSRFAVETSIFVHPSC